MAPRDKKVVIIQEHLPHYRVCFFNRLREELAEHGIALRLIHGKQQASRLITQAIPWADPVAICKVGPFAWHCLGKRCRGADLIIAPQETKYLRGHLLHLSSKMGGAKFAYWGHGRNFQAQDAGSASERLKRFLSKHVDWWFAYNDLSAGIIRELDFPAERITSVGNAIDTVGLRRLREQVTDGQVAELRERLSLPEKHVAIYSGGLYPTKRIPFLLESAVAIRELVPDFQLLVMGDGPERDVVREAADRFPWIHFLGPKNDEEKVPYWSVADILLMPGGVGLAILDSFALEVPIVTTDTKLHGPEISYLESGRNGLLVTCGEYVHHFASEAAALLDDPARLTLMKSACASSASTHTIEKMVANFAVGVRRCLGEP